VCRGALSAARLIALRRTFIFLFLNHPKIAILFCHQEDSMRVDLYTKIVLTVIAGVLLLIAINPLVRPKAVEAQNAGGYQFFGVSEGIVVVDQQSNMWLYPMDIAKGTGDFPRALGKISRLGEYPAGVDRAK
jgi:hypothetical protein